MSFGLIGGSSFGRPTIGWNNSSSMNKSDRKAVNTSGRSGGRMGGKNFHEVATPNVAYIGNGPQQRDRVNYGPKDVSMSAKGTHQEHTKADRLHSFKNNNNSNKGGNTMRSSKQNRSYKSGGGGNHGGGGNNSHNFSFDKSINNGISTLPGSRVQNPMGGGAHLQSLELPRSSAESGKLFVKNVTMKPTGYLESTNVANFFKTRIFPAYKTMLQERVNYKIDIQPAEFQQWFFNIQEGLNVWFYVNSVMNYYAANPAGNTGMFALREFISAESLSLHDQLGQILQTKVMDPNMVELIRYMHDVYQVSATNPQSALIKFSYDRVILQSGGSLEKLLNTNINALSNVDLLKVNSLMKKAKPEWCISLQAYDGTAKYDENFLTFWSNIPELFMTGGNTYMKPYVKDNNSNFEEKCHFGIYGNDYSELLSGLTCFNVSDDGQAVLTGDSPTVKPGFIVPQMLSTDSMSDIPFTSNLRWDDFQGEFVPAGMGNEAGADAQIRAVQSCPSNVVVTFDYQQEVAAGPVPYGVLKPHCQEPITMTVNSTQQDFNSAMSKLFNWTQL